MNQVPHSHPCLTSNGGLFFCMTNASVPDLLAFWLNYSSDYCPDEPCDKGNDDLNNHDNEPQNAHHQVKDHLQYIYIA